MRVSSGWAKLQKKNSYKVVQKKFYNLYKGYCFELQQQLSVLNGFVSMSYRDYDIGTCGYFEEVHIEISYVTFQ